ncbi:ATP-dependent nuclease [Vibrio sp. K4]|uniref:ATP-dependent nuclease n=1 Tax=Vibrio sp. K4 TaxID=3391579 RepID=UPI003DA72647
MKEIDDLQCLVGGSIPNASQRIKNSFFLKNNSWDDYSYRTTYELYFIDSEKKSIEIGFVKISRKNLEEKERPLENGILEPLDNNYFSLGQEETFYERLRDLPDNYGSLLLSYLNDISHSYGAWVSNKSEESLNISLMRDVTALDVVSYNRIFNGSNDKISYTVRFKYKNEDVVFTVDNSKPFKNSNIHTFIGNNGVGKTTVLKKLVEKIFENDFNCQLNMPDFSGVDHDGIEIPYIDRVLYASFSAFDNNLPNIPSGYKFDYLGLHDGSGGFKGPTELREEFEKAICKLIERADTEYLAKVFTPLLDVDYLREHINEILDNIKDISKIMSIYEKLSSGHRIIVHTLVLLMGKLRQGMITLFDEPETHLHPPLLGAFLQSLQIICNTYNGMIIFATHSPIILQEVLSSNVYILRRVDNEMLFNRPHVTTYGQNVSKLTRTAFGYQNVGFHNTINNLVSSKVITKDNINEFTDIGSEAKKVAWTQLYRAEDEQ